MWHISFDHRWETRTVHVGIKNANFSALLPEGEGQVDGDCRFSYTTLTAADSDDVVNFCEASCALSLLLLGRFLARRHLNFNFVDPGKFLEVFSDEGFCFAIVAVKIQLDRDNTLSIIDTK